MNSDRLGSTLVGLVVALAAAAPASAGTNTVTFGNPGTHSSFAIPPDEPAFDVVAVGGSGGSALGGAIGGLGRKVFGTLATGGGGPAGGSTLHVYIGADGAPGALGAGAGGAPTFLRTAPLGFTCDSTTLTSSTLFVAGAGGGAATDVFGTAVGGDGGDAGDDGMDGTGVNSRGRATGTGGGGEGTGLAGQTAQCPRGGDGGAGGGGTGWGATGASVGSFQFGGDGGDGDGGGGGGGGGVLGAGGGGGSQTGTGGGGAGGSSSTGALSGTPGSVLAAGADIPSLTLSWNDVLAPTVGITSPATSPTRTRATTLDVAGTVSTGLGDPTSVLLSADGPGTAGDVTDETLTVVNGQWAHGDTGYAEGTWTFTAKATDGGGNDAPTEVKTVTFDRTSPTGLSVTSPPDAGYATESQPTFTGTAGNVTGDDPEIIFELFHGAGTGDPLFGAEPVRRSGATWSHGLAEPLADGGYTVRITQGDDVGNPDAVFVSTFTVDTQAPALTVSEPGADDNVITDRPKTTGTRGTAVNDLWPTVTYASLSGVTVTGAVTSSRSSFSAVPQTALTAGTWTVTVRQRDWAGNATEIQRTIDVSPTSLTLNQPGTPTVDSTPTFAGRGARLADGAIDPVAIHVRDTAGNLVQTLTDAVDNHGDYVQMASPALADGTYTVQAFQDDQGGNRIQSPARTFVVDTQGPTITLTSPRDGATNDVRPAAAGTTDESSDVEVRYISDATGTTQTRTATPAAGHFSATPGSDLAEGAYTVRVTQRDALLNPTVVERKIRVDVTAPAPELQTPAEIAPSSPEFTGRGGTAVGDLPTVQIDVYEGESATGFPVRTMNPALARDGSFAVTADPLATGTYTAVVRQSDDATNSGASSPRTFTVDGEPPVVSLTAPPARGNDATPAFSGTTASAETVRVEVRRSADGPVVAAPEATPSGGTFTTVPTAPLDDGSYLAQAVQEDAAGNVGRSAQVAFVVDTEAPSVAISAPAGAVANPRPTITGSAGTAPGDAGTVEVRISGVPGVLEVTVAADGTFSATPDAPLADGTYEATARQVDDVGNARESAPATFRVDTTAPAPVLTAPSGAGNDATPAFAGTAGTAAGDDATVTIEVRHAADQALAIGPLQVQRDGSVLAGSLPELADGAYVVRAVQADSVGNTGRSAPLGFEIDRVAPVVDLAPLDREAVNTGTPTFTGVAGLAHGDAALVRVEITRAGDMSPIATLDTTRSLTGTFTATTQIALPDGEYTARARQLDHAGNAGHSNPIGFTVDTRAPVVSIGLPLSGGRTRTATPVFAGTAEPGLDVRVEVLAADQVVRTLAGAAQEDGSYTAAVTEPLTDGPYTARALQDDRAGNAGSATVAFVVDTTAPAVTVTQPAAGSTTADQRPEVTGTAGAAEGDATALDVVFTGPTTVTVEGARTSSGGFAVRPPAALALGAYTVEVVQRDVAGNEGRSAKVAFTIAAPHEPEPTPTATPSPAPTASPTPSATPTPTPTPAAPVARVAKRVTLDRRGRLRATVLCGRGAGTCTGTLRALVKRRSLAKRPARYAIAAGKRRTLTLRLTPRGRRVARRAGRITLALAWTGGSLAIPRRLSR